MMRLVLALVALFWWQHGTAAINLMGTRIVYRGDAREANLDVRNQGGPTLLQTWVDSGDERQGPDRVESSFLVVPPMMRLGPDQGQTLRIFGADLDRLPQDRESLFWLNVLGLPPKASGTANSVLLAFRTRIKLFYRPAGLKGSVAEAVTRLRWQAQAEGLSVSNPSPFHISLSEVLLEVGGRRLNWQQAGLIPPYGLLKIPIRLVETTANRGRARWIDDDGTHHEQGFVLDKQGGQRND